MASELASSDSIGATGAGRGQALRLNALALALLAGGWYVGAQAAVIIDGTTPVTTTGGSGITCAQPAAGGVWTCQIPRSGGGFATITGITGADGVAAIAAANAWATTNLTGGNAIALGTQTTKAGGANSIAFGSGAVTTAAHSSTQTPDDDYLAIRRGFVLCGMPRCRLCSAESTFGTAGVPPST